MTGSTLIMTFFILIGGIILVLSIALAIVFVRLGRELNKVGQDTESMITKLQRSTRLLQFILPVMVALRGRVTHFRKTHLKRSSNKRGSL